MSLIERARVAVRDWLTKPTAEEAAAYAAAREQTEQALSAASASLDEVMAAASAASLTASEMTRRNLGR